MTRPNDEKLMAYIDGELPENERAVIEAAIKAEPELEARLNIFAAVGQQLAEYYDAPMRQPAPDHLIDLVLTGSAQIGARPGGMHARTDKHEQTQPANDITTAITQWLNGWLGVGGFRYSLAGLLIGVALTGLVAVGLGVTGGRNKDQTGRLLAGIDGQLIAKGQLNEILEAHPSGRSTTISGVDTDGGDVTVRLTYTFLSSAHNYCRQYQLNIGSATRQFSGIACRQARGAWNIAAHIEQKPSGQAKTDNFKPAGGHTPQPIDQVVERLAIGDVLGDVEEQRLLDQHWKQEP